MSIEFNRNRTPLHALLEDNGLGVDGMDLIRSFRQLRRQDVHGDDLTWLDLLRNELPRRLGAINSIEEEKIDRRPIKGIAVQVGFTLLDERIAHMEETRASHFDNEGQVPHG